MAPGFGVGCMLPPDRFYWEAKHGAITGGLYRLTRGTFTFVESGQDRNVRENRLTIHVIDLEHK